MLWQLLHIVYNYVMLYYSNPLGTFILFRTIILIDFYLTCCALVNLECFVRVFYSMIVKYIKLRTFPKYRIPLHYKVT